MSGGGRIVHRSDVVGVRSLVRGATLPFDLSHAIFDVAYSPPHGQPDACENITFPQLHLRVVKILCQTEATTQNGGGSLLFGQFSPKTA